MGGTYWGFELHFSRSKKETLEREFIKALTPFAEIRSPTTDKPYYDIWLKVPGGGALYSLNTTATRVTLITDMSIKGPEIILLDDVMLAVAQQLNPLRAISIMETLGTINELTAIYYSDPYYFLLEPPSTDPSDIRTGLKRLLQGFKEKKKLAEIKKILPLEELVEVLQKHCEKVVFGQNGGVGILKGSSAKANATYVFPHYFLRQLVRQRGVALKEGFAEKYAMKLGIK